ncbi:hypothetical protein [Natrinema salaciae]|uniref:hypothetical protein n=1 Tax=Natrinema salaciae TaxID=1186196 RepID=UPI00111387A9|nr:hypothetical protein [Natrinema salaciae]
MVTFDPDEDALDGNPFRPPQGTVMLFWGATGTDLIDDIETAIVKDDLDAFSEVGEMLLENEELLSRELPTPHEGVEKALEAPAIFDFSYGSRELGRNLALRELPLGAMTFPYTGGELDPDEFTIRECPCGPDCPPSPPWPDDFPWPDGPDGPFPPNGFYDYLVVASPPEMSDIERRAMETIPSDVDEANILPNGPVSDAVLVAAVVVAVAVATSTSPGVHEDLREVSLPDDTVNQLGSRAAVGELLDMRREVLHEHGFA